MISGIEPSPFDAGTVYVAGTRYKLDDNTPYLYVTHDYGEHWGRIDSGIPRHDFTRVIRADPARRGLLYAGTETGVYVSTDDGANWKPFQINLPVSPIYELLVKDSDLIAGTHGRSIWILDDLTPLHQLVDGVPDGVPHLFAPRQTTRVLPGIDWSGIVPGSTNYLGSRGGGYVGETTPDGEQVRTWLDAGENPPRGAIITYRLAAAPEEPITLTFKNAKGDEVRSFTSRKPDDELKAKERRVPAKAGWNRFVWDLKHKPATKIVGSDPPSENTYEGPFVAPGEYTVILKVGETELTQALTVVKPSTVPATKEDLEAQEALLLQIHKQIDRTVVAVNRMRDLRGQLEGWAARTKDREGGEAIEKAATELRDKALEIEKTILIPGLRKGWNDPLNEGTRLLDKLAGLPPAVQLGDYRPTDVAAEVLADLTERIDAEIARFDELVDAELTGFNATIAEAKFGAVALP